MSGAIAALAALKAKKRSDFGNVATTNKIHQISEVFIVDSTLMVRTDRIIKIKNFKIYETEKFMDLKSAIANVPGKPVGMSFHHFTHVLEVFYDPSKTNDVKVSPQEKTIAKTNWLSTIQLYLVFCFIIGLIGWL